MARLRVRGAELAVHPAPMSGVPIVPMIPPAHVAIATSRWPSLFAPLAAPLGRVTFRVLVPTTFDRIDLRAGGLYTRVNASPHTYRIEIDYDPDCNGANVCSAGSISGYDATYRGVHHAPEDGDAVAGPRRPDADDREAIAAGTEIFDRPVHLARGLLGYYDEARSGASDGGNSSLRWLQHGIVYAIVTRISDERSLVATANGAIAAGGYPTRRVLVDRRR